MGLRTCGSSDLWVVGLVGLRTCGSSDLWVVGLVGRPQRFDNIFKTIEYIVLLEVSYNAASQFLHGKKTEARYVNKKKP